jgi:hypothetical protein
LQHTWILDDLRDKYNRIEQQKAEQEAYGKGLFRRQVGKPQGDRGKKDGVDSDLGSRCPQSDRCHRAGIDASPAFIAGAFPLFENPEETDPCVKASLGKIHLRTAFLCSANPHAPSTQNTPVGIEVYKGMVFHDSGLFEIAFKALRFQTHSKEFG